MNLLEGSVEIREGVVKKRESPDFRFPEIFWMIIFLSASGFRLIFIATIILFPKEKFYYIHMLLT